MSENVLILGATSGIAKELSRVLADRGCSLVLAGRNRRGTGKIGRRPAIAVSGPRRRRSLRRLGFRRTRRADCPLPVAARPDRWGHFVLRLFAGPATDRNRRRTKRAVRSISTLPRPWRSWLPWPATWRAGDSGYLAAISSVAGDRGRQSNYTYGAAKAGLTAYLQGLRNRLYRSGVHVLTIKPGFVDTPMTRGARQSQFTACGQSPARCPRYRSGHSSPPQHDLHALVLEADHAGGPPGAGFHFQTPEAVN